MINKIYVKVWQFIKEEYKYLLFLSFILFLGFFHLPYNIYVGGGVVNLNNRLEVENEIKESGSYNLAYVKSVHATIPSYLLSYVFDWDRESLNNEKISDEESARDIWKREQLYLQEANDNAIIAAFRLAGEELTINKEILKILYVDKSAKTNLKIGDTILSVDGVDIKEFTDLKEVINKHELGKKLQVKYQEDEKIKDGYFDIINLDNEKKAGLYLIKLYDYSKKREVKLKFNKNEGGPSGGFMTSLAIYSRLIGMDLTKGKKIVGTGTIDANGNVGEIGGVKYKLKGAVKNKADIFFVPEKNYAEAIKLKEEKKYQIDIVMVKNLNDAVTYLKMR